MTTLYIVYSLAKTGTLSLSVALSKQRYHVIQSHPPLGFVYFHPDKEVEHGSKVSRFFNIVSKFKNIKVITLTRNPTHRRISQFFHVFLAESLYIVTQNPTKGLLEKKIIKDTIERKNPYSEDEIVDLFFEFFDDPEPYEYVQMKQSYKKLFGVDLPNPVSNNIVKFRVTINGHVGVGIILRLEDMNDLWIDLSNLLNLSPDDIPWEHKSSSYPYCRMLVDHKNAKQSILRRCKRSEKFIRLMSNPTIEMMGYSVDNSWFIN